MATLINDKDIGLQASPYRDKSTLVTVSASNTNFILGKNGGGVTPVSTTLTATPNNVFTNAAVYSWYYALNTAATSWKGFTGGLLQGKTTFNRTGTSISAIGTYNGISPLRTSGSGTGATFNIVKSVTGTSYSAVTITIANSGIGYQLGDTIAISGASLGGATPANDLIITVLGNVSTLTGITQSITGTTIKSLVGLTNATSIQFKCEVEETMLETAYGYASVVYSLEQANSDSINIELSKVASTVSLSATGAGVYTGTGTSITVSRAGASLVYDANGGLNKPTASANSFTVEIINDSGIDATVPNRTAGGFTTTSTTYIFSGITNLTTDYATVTFRVMVYDASGNKTQTTLRQIQYSRVASGVPGVDAVSYFIDYSSALITKSTSSVYETGQFSPITIYGKKLLAGVSTNYGFITVTGDVTGGSVESGTAIDVSVNPYVLNIANTAQDTKYTVRMYTAANRGASGTQLLDTQVLPVLFTGSSAIICNLSNESASIAVSSTGTATASSYYNTNTLIRVFEGTTELTYVTGTTATANGTWAVVLEASTGVSVGTTSSVSAAKYASQSVLLGMTQDTGYITFKVSGKTQAGKDFSFNRIQNFNKIYPGIDSTLYYLEITTPVISKGSQSTDADGVHTNITITGKCAQGQSTPTNSGYITVAPNVKITAVNTNGSITCTGVGMFTVNSPIVFTGIMPVTGLIAGTVYYIKTIDTTTKTITISSTASGSLKTYTGSASGLTSIYAYSEPTTGTSLSSTTNIPNNAGIHSLLIKLYSTANRLSATLLDSQEIIVLYKGASAITGILSNDAVTIPCTQDLLGNITPVSGAYNSTPTSIRVFEGSTELTYVTGTTATANGTWVVTSTTQSNITKGAITASGIYAVTANAADIQNDIASLEFFISGKTTGGATFSFTKKQTLNRAINGKAGLDGKTYKTAVLTAYAWSNTGTAPTRTGFFNYTWATQTLTAQSGVQTTGSNIGYPTGWSAVSTSSPGAGYSVYQLFLTISDESTATVTNGNDWSKGKTGSIGYTPSGAIGFTGDAARVAYIVTSSPVPPLLSNLTAGVGDSVPTGSDGTWSFTPTQVLEPGQFMYQSDGTYSVNTQTGLYSTTWRAPYLSNLKVAYLSAISADLGAINAGSINIGPDKFVVGTNGNVSIKGAATGGRMEINNEVIRIYDTNGSLRVKLGNLSYADYG